MRRTRCVCSWCRRENMRFVYGLFVQTRGAIMHTMHVITRFIIPIRSVLALIDWFDVSIHVPEVTMERLLQFQHNRYALLSSYQWNGRDCRLLFIIVVEGTLLSNILHDFYISNHARTHARTHATRTLHARTQPRTHVGYYVHICHIRKKSKRKDEVNVHPIYGSVI